MDDKKDGEHSRILVERHKSDKSLQNDLSYQRILHCEVEHPFGIRF